LLTEQSIGDLFIAGIVPGLLLALVFALGVMAMATWFPGFTGTSSESLTAVSSDDGAKHTAADLLTRSVPMSLLILIVFGGIYSGFFTPTEAGAVGSLVAMLLGLCLRRLSWLDIKALLKNTGLVTASVCFLILSAQMYSRMLSLSGLPTELGSFLAASGQGYWFTLLAYVGLLILMGAILDSASIMLIMVPLMLPVIAGFDIDLIWFGIVTVIAVEIGLLTPPFGMAVFVIKGALNDPSISLSDVFLGAAPFAVLMLVVLALVMTMPWLATGLL